MYQSVIQMLKGFRVGQVLGFRLKKERSGTGGGLNCLRELGDTVPVPTGDCSEKANKLQ